MNGFLATGCAAAFCLAVLVGPGIAASDGDRAEIQQQGTAILYRGPIEAAGVGALLDTHSRAADRIEWLIIDSAGGEINLAMDIGDWVHSNRINVRVTDQCLSSCANYVFTAAQVKVIEPGAVVAWHGSAIQSEAESRRAITELIEREILPDTAKEERERRKAELLDATLLYLETAKARQAEFFEKIGVDERITTVGEGNPAVRDFWFMSVESMAAFGVDLVVAPSDYTKTDTSRFGEGSVIYIDIGPLGN